jgi:LysM repeat protein
MGTVRRPGSNEYLVFLVLNVIVSAITVTVILLIFGRVRSPETSSEPAPTLDIAAQVASAIPTATITPIPPPTPVTYTVRPGDTLFAIAEELGVDVEDLMAANGLSNPDTLDIGQVLVVPEVEQGAPGEGGSTMTGGTASTPNPDEGAPQVEIREVTGAGDLESETVLLINRGGEVLMAGWTLDDGRGHRYIFPNFVLHNNGAVSLRTRAGRDTAIDLFWNLDEAVWLPGTTITLRDADDDIHSTFEIP